VKNLAALQAECAALGLKVEAGGRTSKRPFIVALREYHWQKDHPGKPLPAQVMPMLLSDWADLEPDHAQAIEQGNHAWIVQPKLDGVRALLHIETGGVRITSRYVSEITFRLSEFQKNVPHLTPGLSGPAGTILDGELVCPVAAIDTGNTITATGLQAAVAVLSTTPENARRMQDRHRAHLRFHVFDMLQFRGKDLTPLPLVDRLDFLAQAVREADNPHLEMVPSFVIGKAAVHRSIIKTGGEGTVWKKVDQSYQPGRRVNYWIKRKRGIEMEAFVSGFKLGKNGHAHVIGAVEFSIRDPDGTIRPIAWVSNWTDKERQAMTERAESGTVRLNSNCLGRRAIITGQEESARSRRIRHARVKQWVA
jgi:ATP-dependent DNA ligase